MPLSTQPALLRRARVVRLAASEPMSGSVSAKEPTTSPEARRGSQCRFCSAVPSITSPWLPMPMLVEISARKAGEVRAIAKPKRTSSSMVSPRPPNSSGIDSPNKPIARISATSSSGTWSLSATSASRGISRSRTNRATSASSASSVSRSRIIPGAILTVVVLVAKLAPR